MDLELDLRSTSDELLHSLEQLSELENEKRTLKPDSDRFQSLALDIERLAADVFAYSHAQQTLGEQALQSAARTGADIATINATQPVRELPAILSDWRAAERRLSVVTPGTEDHAAAASDVRRLRAEYHAAYPATQSNAAAASDPDFRS